MCNSNQINFLMMQHESIHSSLNWPSCTQTFVNIYYISVKTYIEHGINTVMVILLILS